MMRANSARVAAHVTDLGDDRSTGSDNGKLGLLQRFASLRIPASIVPYPPHATVEEGKRLRGNMAGTFTKNLLLKDKKGRLFLLAIHEDRQLELKTLHTKIGGNGRLGFASPDNMQTLLGVSPGALTPLGIINDRASQVTVVIDSVLLEADQVNFHPLVQHESIGVSSDELIAFVRSCDREPLIVDLGPVSDTATTAAIS